MAIKKAKELETGVSGEYWKIVQEVYSRTNKVYTWTIELFKDQSASQANKKTLGPIKNFSKILSTEEQQASDKTALGYNYIKSLNDSDLIDGEDV